MPGHYKQSMTKPSHAKHHTRRFGWYAKLTILCFDIFNSFILHVIYFFLLSQKQNKQLQQSVLLVLSHLFSYFNFFLKHFMVSDLPVLMKTVMVHVCKQAKMTLSSHNHQRHHRCNKHAKVFSIPALVAHLSCLVSLYLLNNSW